MTVLRKLKDFLDKSKVKYKVFTHPEVYTAQEVAASVHVRGKELAKVVMIKSKDKEVMAVLPASHKVNIEKVREILKDKSARLATEGEFKDLFPECDVGAMPPFGNLFNVETYVDESLSEDEEIDFQAGTHVEVIRMKYKDYENLVKPKTVSFAEHL